MTREQERQREKAVIALFLLGAIIVGAALVIEGCF